ncbi:MAG: cytochrome c maturation protein CcmE [Microthrixaceae bacterium]
MAETPLDLTPRTGPGDAVAPRSRSSRRAWTVVGIGVLVALVVAVVMGLSDATVFFRNVDEAVAQRAELGDQAFRMQGSVVPDSVEKTDNGVNFELAFNGATAMVEHTGSEPALFENTDIPVVAEGHWQGEVFRSERLVIKHDESYDEENPQRIDEANRGGTAP